jgi:hypothetical protein
MRTTLFAVGAQGPQIDPINDIDNRYQLHDEFTSSMDPCQQKSF